MPGDFSRGARGVGGGSLTHLSVMDGVKPPVESVDRALVMVLLLADAGPQGLSLTDLAAQMQLTKGSVHRVLSALRFRGFASQDVVSGRYVLGAAAAQVGAALLSADRLVSVLRPVLTAVCREVGELVHVGVVEGTSVVYVDKVEPERAVRVFSAVGARVPAARTAMGRAMIAALPVEERHVGVYAQAAGYDGVQVVWEAVRAARACGFASEVEENEAGISCVAVPVMRGGVPVAAVSVTAPSVRFDDVRRAEVGVLLRSVVGDGVSAPLSVGL